MSDWISAADAFNIVLGHEMDPRVTGQAVRHAIAEGDLPGKGVDRSSGEEQFLSQYAKVFSGNGISSAQIDFETGIAVISQPSYAFITGDHSAPFDHTYLDDVVFSRKHLMALWPDGSGAPHRPKGSGLERADAAIIERMVPLVNAGLSPTAAAKQVVGNGERAPGAGTPESKVNRLVKRFKESRE